MKPIALLIGLALGSPACPSAPYSPCDQVEDCDPEVSDACVHSGRSTSGWCSSICQEDDDCPPGPAGQAAVCRPVSEGQPKVCALTIS